MRAFPIPALLFSLAPAVLPGQTVRIRAVEEGGDKPIAGAIVSLVVPKGAPPVRAMTDELGRATLTTRTPGLYRLRGDRIGFSGAVSDTFRLAAGTVRDIRFELPASRQMLREITVTARPVCGIELHNTQISLTALWEEARKALLATEVTRESGILPLEVRGYERWTDRNKRPQKTVSEWEKVVRTERPFAAVPMPMLEAYGCARKEGNDWFYYAPDAPVLLSDYFLDTHCFRAVVGEGAPTGMVGLAFEPRLGTSRPDVMGTLWLDSGDASLRYMEYRYTGLDLSEPYPNAGGRIDFERLPTGPWYIREWVIRAPRLGNAARLQSSEVGGGIRLIGYFETGGKATPAGGKGTPAGASR